MKFITFERDWADEFRAYGFAIMTDAEWADYKKELKSRNSLTYYFGTNEGWEDETGQDFLDSMEVADITDSQAEFLRFVFKMVKTWGQFPDFDFNEIDLDEW